MNQTPPRDAERLDALTVIVITRDAADTLRRCLASVSFAGRVVLVDHGSTDGTGDLARQLGADVTVSADWPGFGPQKNRALALATSPWVLNLDADEWVEAPLVAEIRRIVGGPDRGAAGYRIARRNWYRGRQVKGMGWWPDDVLRLFRRERARFGGELVHESVLVDGPVETLPRDLVIDHEPLRDFGAWILRAVRYGREAALQLHRQGRRGSLARVLTTGPYRLFRDYVLRGGFLYGVAGLTIAATNGFMTFVRDALCWIESDGAEKERR